METEGHLPWLPPRANQTPSQTSDARDSAPTGSIGRRATPRLVRILSVPEGGLSVPVQDTRRMPSNAPDQPHRPRFNAPSLHLEFLRTTNPLFRLYFYAFRTFIFAHLLVQTFFDFNVAYIVIQISKVPDPQAVSGRSWSLAAAAYIACWFIQLFAVFVMYELVYSFARRWRTKRPRIAPLYLSSSSFNFVAIQSYDHFCFMNAIRLGAFTFGNIRDGIAETCWFYSQNLPTVALVFPRAAICVVLLLNFSTRTATDMSTQSRDGTFFREDGTLSPYSRGILFVNTIWAAWRGLILLCSWIGLWMSSGQGCAGVCGPRFRWQESDYERRGSTLSDNTVQSQLPWDWRDCTNERIQEVFDLCVVSSASRKPAPRPLREYKPVPPALITPVRYTEKSPLNSPISPQPRYTQSMPSSPRSPAPTPITVPFPSPPAPLDEDEEEEEEEFDDDDAEDSSEEDRRLAGSVSVMASSVTLSSLGNPISIRQQLDLRRMSTGTGKQSLSSANDSPASHRRSSRSHSDSSGSIMSNVIPPPIRTRNRAGTDPSSSRTTTTTSASAGPSARPRARTRLDSAALQTVVELGMHTPNSVDSHESADSVASGHGSQEDSSPLLPARSSSSVIGASPPSRSHSRSYSTSASPASLRSRIRSSIRSRAQSLVSSTNSGGPSRHNSGDRLDEEDSASSSEGGHEERNRNRDSRQDWTFGQAPPWIAGSSYTAEPEAKGL